MTKSKIGQVVSYIVILLVNYIYIHIKENDNNE